MAKTMCLRCLSQSLYNIQQPLLRSTQIAAFSTSSRLSAQPVKKKTGPQIIKARGGSQLRLKKNTRAPSGRPPAPGERKALRKRIVLSNPNALEVRGLRQFDRVLAGSSNLEAAKGGVLAFNDECIDALRSLQAFKTTQKFSLFRTPCTIVRDETVMLARAIEKAEQSRETTRMIMTGVNGSGKSVLQLQAMSIAKLKGWILIHIPEGQELTCAQTSYEPFVDDSGETRYIQPHYTAKLLEYTLIANNKILSELQLSKRPSLPVPIPENISLARLLELGSRDSSIAWPIWQVLMQELSTKSVERSGGHRPPVLFTIDSMNHVMKLSQYVDPEMRPIHAHELALIKSYMGYLNGTITLPNGGLVLGCTSASNCPATPTFSHILESRCKAAAGQEQPVWDAYAERDPLVEHALQGVEIHKLGGLRKTEAKSVMEYFALSGVYRERITDALVAEKWSVSGGGVVGELEKSCVKQKF